MSYSSSRSSSRNTDCKVYVGDLGNGAAKGELERAFNYYGPLRSVWVARNPPGFAFVEYEDPRDAEDATKGMDGKWVHVRLNCIQQQHSMEWIHRLNLWHLNFNYFFSDYNFFLNCMPQNAIYS